MTRGGDVWCGIWRISVYAIRGESNDVYYSHITAAEHRPNLTMDDGADLVHMLHASGRSCWRTSSAAPKRPLPALSGCAPWPKRGVLRYPIVAVNDAHQTPV
jgi:adenosylhomocysteinase